jgi:uncharacterized protein (TIGR02466 family)
MIVGLDFAAMSKAEDTFDYKVEARPAGFFETPIVYANLNNSESLLDVLQTSIRQRQKDDAGLQRSNSGGWHSDTQMLRWAGEPAQKLADTAVELAKKMSFFQDSSAEAFDWKVRMWANVTSQQGFNHLHVHPGNLWAAVLYLDMGQDEGVDALEKVGGEFYIEDPRFPMISMHTTAFRMRGLDGQPQQIQPEFQLTRGDLIVFPSWLRHGVHAYLGKRDRISVAMNIDVVAK